MFPNYPPDVFTDLILDVQPSTSVVGLRHNNATRAYLSVRNKNYILCYSLIHNEVQKLKIQPSHVDLFSPAQPLSITAMSMVTSRGGRLGEVALIYDDIEKAVYYVNLRIGRSHGELYATQLGSLLGSTRRILVDPDGSFYYFVDRDGVLFRWNTRTKLSAENHEVLRFQAAQPASCLLGTQGAVYVVNEKPIDELELIHSQKILDHYALHNRELRCSACD